MNPRLKGNLLVVGQFLLLALLVLSPSNIDFPFGGLSLFISGLNLGLFFVGFLVLAIAVMGLGPSLTAHPIPNKRARLQTSGIYRFVKHPIYSALLLIALALTLAGGLFPHILYFIALYLLLNYKARFEEQQLALRFSEYPAYSAKTGRFLPRLKG